MRGATRPRLPFITLPSAERINAIFQYGAIDPNVGNDRRQQLINTLAQQLAARNAQTMGQVVSPAAGFFGFMRARQQQRLLPNAAVRPAGAGRDTSGTSITGMNNIPGFVSSLLGPGGNARPSSFISPSPGAPAFAPGHLSGMLSPTPGVPVPQSAFPATTASSPMSNPAVPSPTANPANPSQQTSAPTPPPPPPSAVSSSSGYVPPANPTIGTVAVPSSAPGTPPVGLAGPDAKMAGVPASSLASVPLGMVPLGNGIYINPATGAMYGAGSQGLGVMAAHFAAGRAPQ